MTLSRTRRTGVVMVLVSAVMWSTAGLFVRLANVDTGTVVMWRSVFAFLTLACLAWSRRRGRILADIAAIRAPELVTIGVAVTSATLYVLSLQLTSVANVMTVYAALPFIATGMAYLWLGERVSVRFLIAGSIALAAIGLMAGAVATRGDLWGIVAAFIMTCGFGFQLVHSKRHPALQMPVLIAIAAACCVPIALPFAQAAIPAPVSLLSCAMYGVLTTGLGYILAVEGGRLLPSGEAALLSLLDVVLGPMWVWLFFSERPTTTGVVSGGLVLGSVVWYLVTSERPQDAAVVETRAGA